MRGSSGVKRGKARGVEYDVGLNVAGWMWCTVDRLIESTPPYTVHRAA
jgi:hypothetical protein